MIDILIETGESKIMPRNLPVLASNRLRLILENHETALGSTFPPRTRTTLEINRFNRFHSESNLNRSDDNDNVPAKKQNDKVTKLKVKSKSE